MRVTSTVTSGLAVALLFVLTYAVRGASANSGGTGGPGADERPDRHRRRRRAAGARLSRCAGTGSSRSAPAPSSRRYVGAATRVIDLQGQLAIPGFIEGHGHFTGVGEAQLELNLTKATSWDEIVAMVAEAAKTAKPGEWIVGRGWHQEKWTVAPDAERRRLPDARVARQGVAEQSRAAHARQRPRGVRQREGDGALRHHARRRREPAGRRDPEGQPAATRPGCCARRPQALVRTARGTTPRPRRASALELASAEALSKGITTFEDAGSPFATIDLMKKMVDEGKIGVRLWVMVREDNADAAPQAAAVPHDRLRQRPPHRARDQDARSTARSARAARGCSSRTPTSRRAPGSTPPPSPTIERDRQARDGERLPALRPRDRRPRQPRDARTSSSARSRRIRRRRICAGASSTRSTSRRRHPALRPARRDRLDAGHPLHLGRALRARSGSAPARAEEGAYVWQKLMKTGRDRRQRHRRAGRGRRSDPELLRDGQPQDEGRQGRSTPISA